MPHLDKCDLALADVTARVFDGDLAVVLYPALTTKDVVDAGRHLVPLIAVSKSGTRKSVNETVSFHCVCFHCE